MTNYEWIKHLSIEKMVKFLCGQIVPCKDCKFQHDTEGCKKLTQEYRDWLNKEHEE